MRILQNREGEEIVEVHSIRLAREPGELVIELGNAQVVDFDELFGNNLRVSRHVIKAIT